MKINLGAINFHANQKRLELIYFLIKLLPLKLCRLRFTEGCVSLLLKREFATTESAGLLPPLEATL